MPVTIVGNNTPTAGGVVYGDGTNYASTAAGTSGQVLKSNGSSAPSWGSAGIGTVATTSGSANITLTSASAGYQAVTMTALGKAVTLPDATTMSLGGPVFIIRNDGTYPFGIRNSTGTLLMGVAGGGIAYVTLKDNSTSAGSWSVGGSGIEPGLVTADSTFSSSYQGTPYAQFAALDDNKSIHFVSDTSANQYLYAFVVDNATNAVGTPVMVSSTPFDLPRAIFKITSTTAILFYDDPGYATYSRAVVLTVSGATTLSVGTYANLADFYAWYYVAEYYSPKVVALSATLYLASYTTGTNTTVVAVSVSGTTVTIGTPVNIITSNSVTGQTTTYALTATTGLVVYLSGAAAPYTINGVVISVSGTTCAVGTPTALTGLSSSQGVSPSSCLLSSTKCLVAANNNVTSSALVSVFTISGTTVTAGTPVTVESGVANSGSALGYVASSAYTMNTHLTPLTASTALFWYLNTSTSVSRTVVVSESAGTVTAGSLTYGLISSAASSVDLSGYVAPQGTSEFVAIKNYGTSSAWQKIAQSYKVSGTTISTGQLLDVSDVQNATANASDSSISRLSSGTYVVCGARNNRPSGGAVVFKSSGDVITPQGYVSCAGLGGIPYINLAVSSSRIVITGNTLYAGQYSTGGAWMRVISLEVAA